MALPASGSISMNQVNVELGVAGTTQRSLNDTTVRTLFGVPSGQISMSNGWGKSSFPGTLGSYQSLGGGYYTGTQCGYYLFVTTTSVARQWLSADAVTLNAVSETDGYTNTMCNANAAHPAFQYADNLSDGGFSDWYVGARCELQQQYNNSSCGAIPSYGTSRYWSSTEYYTGMRYAWNLSFGFGLWDLGSMYSAYCVRPIRRSVI